MLCIEKLSYFKLYIFGILMCWFTRIDENKQSVFHVEENYLFKILTAT